MIKNEILLEILSLLQWKKDHSLIRFLTMKSSFVETPIWCQADLNPGKGLRNPGAACTRLLPNNSGFSVILLMCSHNKAQTMWTAGNLYLEYNRLGWVQNWLLLYLLDHDVLVGEHQVLLGVPQEDHHISLAKIWKKHICSYRKGGVANVKPLWFHIL